MSLVRHYGRNGIAARAAQGIYWAGKSVRDMVSDRNMHKLNHGGVGRNKPHTPRVKKERSGSGGGGQANAASSGRTTRVPNVRTKGKKRVAYKNKRAPKVDKKFRAKVNKVIDGVEPRGTYFDVYYDHTTIPLKNEQYSGALCRLQQTAYPSTFFDPVSVLNAASVLWNKKTFTQVYNELSGQMFNPRNVAIMVENSYASIIMKNNSQRTVELTLYILKPKTIEYIDPRGEWQAACAAEFASGVSIDNSNPNTLHNKPTQYQAFNNKFSTETINMVLEPGQTINQRIQGPKEMLYKFEKFTNSAGVFSNEQKMARLVMYTIKNDLVNNDFAAVGQPLAGLFGSCRATNSIKNHVVSIETKTDFVLRMPKEAGFVGSATVTAAQGQPLTLAHNVKFKTIVPFTPGIIESAMRIDEEVPTVPEVP